MDKQDQIGCMAYISGAMAALKIALFAAITTQKTAEIKILSQKKKRCLNLGNTEFSTDTVRHSTIRNLGWPDATYAAEIISARCLNIQSTQTWGMEMEFEEDPKIYQ